MALRLVYLMLVRVLGWLVRALGDVVAAAAVDGQLVAACRQAARNPGGGGRASVLRPVPAA